MPLISTFIPLASISFLNSSLVYSTLCSTPFFKCLTNLSNWAWSKFNPNAPQTYSTHRHPPHLRSTLSFYLLWPQTFESSLSFPPNSMFNLSEYSVGSYFKIHLKPGHLHCSFPDLSHYALSCITVVTICACSFSSVMSNSLKPYGL